MSLYDALGVEKNATKENIKKVFRNLSKKHHPDRGGNAEDFHAIVKAYEILSDDKKRKEYDETGRINKEKSEEAKIAEIISMIFVNLSQTRDIKYTDFAREMQKDIERKLHDCGTNILQLNKERTNLEEIKKRLSFQGEIDFISHTLETAFREVEDRIAAEKQMIEILEKAYVVAKKYSYKTDKDPIPKPVWGTFSQQTRTPFGDI